MVIIVICKLKSNGAGRQSPTKRGAWTGHPRMRIRHGPRPFSKAIVLISRSAVAVSDRQDLNRRLFLSIDNGVRKSLEHEFPRSVQVIGPSLRPRKWTVTLLAVICDTRPEFVYF